MSKLANKPILIPKGVTINIQPEWAEIKGPKKTVRVMLHPNIKVTDVSGKLTVAINTDGLSKTRRQQKLNKDLNTLKGTTWALLRNNLKGVSDGFEIKLELVGVGYRAQVQGNKLNLSLGFSHPVAYALPQEVTAQTPTQTEVVLSSHDNQLLGQVAAEIRSYRLPECYKGKGIKFAGERIKLKETKKK